MPRSGVRSRRPSVSRWSGPWPWRLGNGKESVAVNPDFRDLFAALNAAAARYLLVGGYAVAFHAAPRFTKDLDVWTEPTPANAARVAEALRAFGAPLQDLSLADLERAGLVFQIGVPPNRIDIVTSTESSSPRRGAGVPRPATASSTFP